MAKRTSLETSMLAIVLEKKKDVQLIKVLLSLLPVYVVFMYLTLNNKHSLLTKFYLNLKR